MGNSSIKDTRDDYTKSVNSKEFGPKTTKLLQFLTRRVIGQPYAAEHLAKGFARYHGGLKNPRKPINTIIFSGPTGIGKTMMAEELSRYLIADRIIPPMTAIDCQLYKTKYQLSQLIGSPPGYIGYGEPPAFSQLKIDSFDFFIKLHREIQKWSPGQRPESTPEFIVEMYRKLGPYLSVMLLDEVEKAHEDIHTSLLGIIDKAATTLANGDAVDFSNTVLVMTCNIGGTAASDMLSGRKRSVGFGTAVDVEANRESINDTIREQTIETIKEFFPPEFIGRLRSQIVVFRSLSRGDCEKVLENMLDDVQQLVNSSVASRINQEVVAPPQLAYTDEFRNFLLDSGISNQFGLRVLGQTVEQHTIDELSNAMESGEVRPGDQVLFDVKSGVSHLTRKKRTQALIQVPAKPMLLLPAHLGGPKDSSKK